MHSCQTMSRNFQCGQSGDSKQRHNLVVEYPQRGRFGATSSLLVDDSTNGVCVRDDEPSLRDSESQVAQTPNRPIAKASNRYIACMIMPEGKKATTGVQWHPSGLSNATTLNHKLPTGRRCWAVMKYKALLFCTCHHMISFRSRYRN